MHGRSHLDFPAACALPRSSLMPMPAATGLGDPSTSTSRWACTWKNSCSDVKPGKPAAATRAMIWSGRGHGAGPVLTSRCGGVAVGAVVVFELFELDPPPHPATSAPVD